MARDRRDQIPRSSPDPQQRQSRQRRVSAPRDNTLCLNIIHQLIYSGNPRRGVRSPSIFSPTRRESPSQSRSNLGRNNHPGNPLGNPRQNSQGSARAGTPPAARRSHRPCGRPGRSNTPNWRAAPVAACISGANCYPIGSAEVRPIKGSNPAPARVPAREETRHLTRSGRFHSSEVCRGTASGFRCWVCHQTPPPSCTPPLPIL